MTPEPPSRRPGRTVFLGTGPFGVPSLRALASAPEVELVAVVAAPARPAGRHADVRPSPIEEAARPLGLRVLTPERLRRPEAVADVLALRPDLLVVADYGQIVPPALLALPAGALNLHPSRLPRHRGASPIPATLLAGDATTAVTLIRMDEGIDSGPIVAVSPARTVLPDATSASLEPVLAEDAARLVSANLGPWLRGEIEPRPQPDEGVTKTRPLRREDGRLDPSIAAGALERAVRAYEPWPGTFLEAGGLRIGVAGASVAPDERGDVPGTLVGHDRGIALATSDGRLVLRLVRPAGGRAMTGEELRRGRPGLVGTPVVGPGGTMAGR